MSIEDRPDRSEEHVYTPHHPSLPCLSGENINISSLTYLGRWAERSSLSPVSKKYFCFCSLTFHSRGLFWWLNPNGSELHKSDPKGKAFDDCPTDRQMNGSESTTVTKCNCLWSSPLEGRAL